MRTQKAESGKGEMVLLLAAGCQPAIVLPQGKMSLDAFRAFEICQVDISFGGHGYTARRSMVLTLMKKPFVGCLEGAPEAEKEGQPQANRVVCNGERWRRDHGKDCNRGAQKSIPERTINGRSLISDLADPDFKNTKTQEMNWDRWITAGCCELRLGT